MVRWQLFVQSGRLWIGDVGLGGLKSWVVSANLRVGSNSTLTAVNFDLAAYSGGFQYPVCDRGTVRAACDLNHPSRLVLPCDQILANIKFVVVAKCLK